MSLFTVEETLCIQDGLCAADCPVACITFTKGSVPEVDEDKAKYCLSCGHCVAICPTGAIMLEEFPCEGEPIDKHFLPSADAVEHLLKSRRSMRAYKKEPLERAVIEKLLDVTAYAPSGHNARPVEWVVVEKPEKVQEVAGVIAEWMRGEVENKTALSRMLHLPGVVRLWDKGVDLICRSAPSLVVAHAPERGVTPMEDSVIGVTYLEIAAHAEGLGSCWCGYLNIAAAQSETVRKALGIPNGNKVFGSLMLGKPGRKMRSIPPRHDPKVKWL